MSFSLDVKKELSLLNCKHFYCKLVELEIICKFCCEIIREESFYFLKIKTENIYLAKRIIWLIKEIMDIKLQTNVKYNFSSKYERIYTINIYNKNDMSKFLNKINLENKEFSRELLCCKKAYIRGYFISSGSITNPNKNYHIEFLSDDDILSKKLMDTINFFDIKSKFIKRRGKYIVYVKESDGIVNILNLMGAHLSLMELENIRILKDMRNGVNRKVNCETANLNKIVNASVQQINDINYIKNKKGLDYLNDKLKDVANKRLEYPDESLEQIGKMLNPPISKSGVNHRLKKINSIANELID